MHAACHAEPGLEHAVPVLGFRWNNLQDVPVLDDLSRFVEAEDVDACPVSVRARRPHLVAVQDHETAFGHRPLEEDLLAWELLCHSLEVLDEGFLAVSDVRVVLGVRIPGVAFHRLSRLALIEHEVVERDRVLAVLLRRRCHGVRVPLASRNGPTLTPNAELRGS